MRGVAALRVRFPGEKSRTLPVPLVGRVAMTEEPIIIRKDIGHPGEMLKLDVGDDKRSVLKRLAILQGSRKIVQRCMV